MIVFVGYGVSSSVSLAAGLQSAGNTDGVLTWRLGTLAKQQSVREVVLFAFDKSPEAVLRHLEAARRQFAQPLPPPSSVPVGAPKAQVWIANAATDFALEGPCFFRWDNGGRQALRCARGGQLSQFTWYLHYTTNVKDREVLHKDQRPTGADRGQPSGSSNRPAALPPYDDRGGKHRAGTPHYPESTPENLRIV